MELFASASNRQINVALTLLRVVVGAIFIAHGGQKLFVFGLDGDGGDVFARTVDWAVESGITTATFHILTPYPGTALYARMAAENRLITDSWDLYDTRHVVYRPVGLTAEQLKTGYDWSYKEFYRWGKIVTAASAHRTISHRIRHAAYSAGWKKFEPAWDFVIRVKQLAQMRPLLETILSRRPAPGRADFAGGRASSPRDSTSGVELVHLRTSGSFASDRSGT